MAITYVRRVDKDDRLGIRLSSRTKFALDMYTRMTGKTASNVIDEALEAALHDPKSGLFKKTSGEQVFLPDLCWDPLDTDRFVKIGTHAPELLTIEESVLWKVILEDPQYWERKHQPKYKKIREDWGKLKSTAAQLYKEHG